MWYSQLKTKGLLFAAIMTLLLQSSVSRGQHNHEFNCGTDQNWLEKVKQNPELEKQRREMLENLVERRSTGEKGERAGVRVIPVVFHIIHTYGPENIDKQRVLDQVRTLNEQFAAVNKDLASVRAMYTDLIGTPNVEFRLATKDPNGNCTDGIVRKYSTLTENARDNVKGVSYWDADKYLNIWVVSTITNFGGPGTVLGFAQFPWDNNKYTDGIVMRADQVITGNNTLAHEVGHYLGLLHTFESYAGAGCGNPCGSTGDFICDTPPSTGPTQGCPGSTYNSCTMDSPDQPDMWENFMDYSSCQHMFTKGQVEQMHEVFTTTKRTNLISTANLAATGTADGQPSVLCAPVADFYTKQPVVCEGASVTFLDNSFNGAPSVYAWTFENGTPAISNAKDPVIKFTKAGTYKVRLKVSNSSGSNELEKTAIIKVLPATSLTKSPVMMNFEAFNPSGYEFTKDSRGLQWTVSNKAAVSGSNSVWLNNTNGISEQTYMFTIPMVDLTTSPDTRLKFKVAYAQKSANTQDELRVQVSNSCGQNFNSVYYKFGSSLATAGSYYTTTFVPEAHQWRDVEISLASYKTVKNLIIRFNFRNRDGNNIYIDDINIGGTVPTGINDNLLTRAGVTLYPNPANNQVNIGLSGVPAMPAEIEIYDMAGRVLQLITGVRLGDGAGDLQLDRNAMNLSGAGVYLIKITTGSRAYVEKLVITE